MIDRRDSLRDLPMVQLVWDNASSYLPGLRQSLVEEPGFNEQVRWASLASQFWTLGTHGIALEHKFVQDQFVEYAKAILEVFRRRGTSNNDFSYVATPEGIVGPPPGEEIDYSLTNSKRCLIGTLTAMSVREFGLAQEIALLAGDPPKARYISEKSETCRPYDSVISDCIKRFFEGERGEASKRLAKLFISPKEKRGLLLRDGIIAMLREDCDGVCDAVDGLIEWHRRAKPRQDVYNISNPSYLYLCHWALGLANWAIYEGIASSENFRKHDDYQAFPTDWLMEK